MKTILADEHLRRGCAQITNPDSGWAGIKGVAYNEAADRPDGFEKNDETKSFKNRILPRMFTDGHG